MSWIELLGYCGVALVVAANLMRTMIRLRALAIFANVVFAIYFLGRSIYPSALLQCLLLPINSYRLVEMVRLTRKVRAATRGSDAMNWLKPFMSRRRYRRGEVLFLKGAVAEEMFFAATGRYRLVELGIDLPQGDVFGELGLIAPEHRRTQTIECMEDGDVLVISYAAVKELYYQNPEFGFYFLGLASGRLFENLHRLEQQIERLRAEPLRAEPLRAEPLGAEPLGAEPLGAEPLGAEPLGAEPLRTP